MASKVKRAVQAALARNEFTSTQDIEVKRKGRIIVLCGAVDSEDLIFEAIATVEAISPLLDVRSRLTVAETEAIGTPLLETTAVV